MVGAQPGLEPQPAQHVHGVAADLDAGAQARELPRLLVDRDLAAGGLRQRRRRREPAHAGADDGDMKPGFCHAPTMPKPRRRSRGRE